MVYPSLLERLVIINAPHPVLFARELLNSPEQQQASQYMLVFKQDGIETFLSANNFAMLADALWGETAGGRPLRKRKNDTYRPGRSRAP